MPNIIWVYGSSAAGKETFIRNLLLNPSKDLIDYLGWNDKKIVCVEESLQYIGQFTNDPIVEKRQQIIEKAKRLATQSNIVILIKGQDVDLKFDLLNKLRQAAPNAKHEIIFLHANLEILFDRSRRKSWWSAEDEAEGIEGFRSWLIDNQLKPLQDLEGFPIFTLDSTDHDYKPTPFPFPKNI